MSFSKFIRNDTRAKHSKKRFVASLLEKQLLKTKGVVEKDAIEYVIELLRK